MVEMRIKVARQGQGFVATVPPSSVHNREIKVSQPVSPLSLMEYLCSFGYDQYEVSEAILEADKDAFDGTYGLD